VLNRGGQGLVNSERGIIRVVVMCAIQRDWRPRCSPRAVPEAVDVRCTEDASGGMRRGDPRSLLHPTPNFLGFDWLHTRRPSGLRPWYQLYQAQQDAARVRELT
jgi:hypothetical protein